MKNAFLLGIALVCAVACSKTEEQPATKTTNATVPAKLAVEDVDCEKVVEKIASFNPPDSRGEPEKKLWRKMCADMKPAQKTCVMGASNMEGMKGCK